MPKLSDLDNNLICFQCKKVIEPKPPKNGGKPILVTEKEFEHCIKNYGNYSVKN